MATADDNVQIPEKFQHLRPYWEAWDLPDAKARLDKRLDSELADLKAFYKAVEPQLDELVEFLKDYRMDAMPANLRPLANMLFALTEIDNPVNKRWGGVELKSGVDARQLYHKSSFYDARLSAG